MYAEIIPVRRMPTSLPFLDYSVPDEFKNRIKVGQLIKIELRKRAEFGIVKNLVDFDKKKLKTIEAIYFDEPLLSPQQISFLIEMSEFYKTSLGFMVKSNLLPLQKRKLEALAKMPSKEKTNSRPKQMLKPNLLFYQNNQDKSVHLEKLLNTEGQKLILVPELADIDRVFALLPKTVADQILIYSGSLSQKDSFARWMKMWTGEKNIVLGTRAAIFLPWANLTTIIVDDEANLNYKSWDMSPRFHTKDAVAFLAMHHGAVLNFLSHTPSVESYYFATKGVYTPQGTVQRFKTMPTIVNLKDERRSGNFGVISQTALEAIQSVNDGDVFLFINRLGSFSYVSCADCKEPLTCAKCDKALAVFKNEKILRCPNCFDTYDMVSSCPTCQGLNLRTLGVGTQSAEEDAKKNFGSKMIVRVDSESDNLADLKSEGDKIIVGTQYAWPHVDWSRIKLLVFLDADSALLIPEYRAIEEFWQKLRDATFKLPNAKLIIQTRRPDHNIFTFLGRPDQFYLSALKERKLFGYPPYNFIVRMFSGHAEKIEAENIAIKASKELKSLTLKGFTGKLTDPLPMTPFLRNGKFWYVILAKIPYNSYKRETKLLASKLGDEWKIDPNPNTILSH